MFKLIRKPRKIVVTNYLMVKLCCLVSFLLMPLIGSGQKEKVDSLNRKLIEEKDKSRKVDLLIKLCEYCEINDNLKYANSALDLITELKKSTQDSAMLKNLLGNEAAAYSYIGAYYGNNNFYDKNKLQDPKKAVLYYDKSVSIYKQLKQWDKIKEVNNYLEGQYSRDGNMYMILQVFKDAVSFGKANNNNPFVAKYIYQTARFYAHIGDSLNAMKYAEEGIELEKKINDPERLAKGYELGGDLYFNIRNYSKAIELYNKALAEYDKKHDTSQHIVVYFGLGNTYAALKNYTLANENLKRALSYADTVPGRNAFFIEINIELGRLEYKFGNYEKARSYHQFALDKSEQMGFPGGIATSCHELAKDLLQLNQLQEAKKYAEQALTIKKQIAGLEQVMKSEQLCFQVDSALGNFQTALSHYMAYTRLQEKINIEEVKKSTIKDELQTRFEQEKEKQTLLQQKKDEESAMELKQQKYLRNSFIAGFLLLGIIALFIYRNFVAKKKFANEIAAQKQLIEEKQHEIIDSITYAKRLQEAILPPQEFVDKSLLQNFIYYKPKDIVAGDFYWAEKVDHLFFIAAADSTGHGVPGAMVSVVCSNALNRSLKEFNLTATGEILDKTRELVIETFEKSASEVKDGMDISLLCIDTVNKNISWSGANNPLWYIQDEELIEIKADKQPIGQTYNPKPFTTHQVAYKPGTLFYLFTDGFADQFGGPNGKKFKYKQFSALLLEHRNLPLEEQAVMIDNAFSEWKGDLEQVDDVCVIGIKI